MLATDMNGNQHIEHNRQKRDHTHIYLDSKLYKPVNIEIGRYSLMMLMGCFLCVKILLSAGFLWSALN